MAEALVAFKRLQMFLEYEEKSNELPESSDAISPEQLEERHISILMKNVSAQWTAATNAEEQAKKVNKKVGSYKSSIRTNDSRPLTLREVDLEMPKGKLIGMYHQL